ncbi:MAG: hypothetical protein LBL24_00710 [Bacteroidales bacterium]|jgi:uncharacterized protein YfaS (alpha-2-macroglobulin family)|nr:hypothetical protein [Bacteroidales bacterium]
MKRFFVFSIVLLFAAASMKAQGKFGYIDQWKTINKLMDGILPQSALPEIEKLQQAALKDKAYGQLIKAVMTRNACLQLTEEKPQVAVINSLKKDAETIPFPAKSMVYSLTADACLNYYTRKMHERTALTEGAESDDIETWDAARLIREAVYYYSLSLIDPVLLQKIPVDEFKEAFEGDASTRYLCPTLYDFLARRAIDAYMTDGLRIANFSQASVIDNPACFGDAQSFIELSIPATDSLAPAYLILKLFQELTAFRLSQNDINSLTDVNLKRYAYLKDHGNFDDVAAVYEDAMENLVEACAGQKIWGKAAYTLAVYHKQCGEKNTRQYKHSLVDAVNLCRKIEKDAPLEDDRKLAADMLKELTQPDANIFVANTLIPHTPALAMITYRNLHAACLSIYRYNPEEPEEFSRLEDLKNDAQGFLSRQEKMASHSIVLPAQTDYRKHSFEIKIDTLPAGNYLLVVSDKSNPARDKLSVLTFHDVQVTGIKLLQRVQSSGNIEAYVVDARSGKPLPKAQVATIHRVYDQGQSKYTYIPGDTLLTDTCGIVVLPGIKEYGSTKLRISYNGEELTKDVLFVYSGQEQKAAVRTALFTDRAIYRPGQTVYFKGLMYETDDGQNAVMPKTKTVVQLMDVNGKELTSQEFITSEYGSFNGSFTLPQGAPNGYMTISNERYGSVGIRVEEYKRPTFEIIMDPVTADYVLGDTITLTGIARALAGYPVDGARVEFSVMRRRQYRPFKMMVYPPRRNDRHITTGALYTGSRGQFTVKFPAKAEDIKMDDNGIYRYQMNVDITDNNGETRSVMQEVALSRVPLLVEHQVPEKIFVGDPSVDSLKYPLKITNLNGKAVAASVQVEVWALKSPGRLLRNRLWQQPDTFVMPHDEFAALFPNDPYAAEDQPSSYARESRVATLQATTPKDTGIDLGILRDAPSGWYFVKLKTTGAHNATVADSVFIQLQQGNAPIISMKEWVAAVKDSGEPGDVAVFRIAGGNDSSFIRCDVLFKDRVVERKWLIAGRIPQELRFPISETFRGGFAVAFAMVQDNREYVALQEIKVPYTNKELDIAFTSFRGQLLPGEKEKWTLAVKNKKGEREAAEMVATLYDASLDQFAKLHWKNYFYPNRSHDRFGWKMPYFSLSGSQNMMIRDDYRAGSYKSDYERLIGQNPGEVQIMIRGVSAKYRAGAVANDDVFSMAASEETGRNETSAVEPLNTAEEKTLSPAAIPLRTDFSETAFFYPELRTGEKGEILVEFTVPEALTRWNMLGFAHTKDFKTGRTAGSLITQKQVAISANLPRFFRAGDTLTLSAKVNNLTEKDMTGKALLRLYDAFTMQPVDVQMLQTDGTQSFAVKAGQSAAVQWKLAVPATLQAVACRLTAQAGNHTDGEERSAPVLGNRTLVTETMPFMVRGDQREDFRFDRLADYSSGTLKNHRLTLEYTSNPAWYAVQALPYLMEYPYDCAEQTFVRFYANTLATTVVNSSPKVKQIFNQWRSLPDSKALVSNLEKNGELKQALLEETPWVMQAVNETERRKRIGLLFDLNRMANEQKTALDKLKAMQGANGGFPWFAGQPEDRFVTQHIVAGLEHLRILNALPRTEDVNTLVEQAMEYCDVRIREDYKNAQKRAEERTGRGEQGGRLQINRTQLHYLYTCSFSQHYSPDQQSFDFYMQQAEKSWARFNVYEQAMIALIMYRFGKPDVAQSILRSLKERAQTGNDLGMYWADHAGYFWNESPVETQAMLIEAFNEAGSDTRAVNEMKIWLLRNKQTTDWKTTKATSEAIYALLSTGDELLGDKNEPLDIRIGGKPLKKAVKEPLRPEAGTGYVNTSWTGNDVHKGLANLRITNPNSNIMWGAMYWQYFEDMDKTTSTETNLQITKKLFIKRSTAKGKILEPVTGSNCPHVGDVITVRMELRADRDFEYVHLKDMRAAGFEPVNTLSGYRFQDGLGYYESIKDASVNFFISYLRKGTYVFEYDLRVANAGDFSNGITTFRCMYAPGFNAHSEGVRVKVSSQ